MGAQDGHMLAPGGIGALQRCGAQYYPTMVTPGIFSAGADASLVAAVLNDCDRKEYWESDCNADRRQDEDRFIHADPLAAANSMTIIDPEASLL
ncbi:hypothetical protein ACELLULO517_21810 [Acidisoma cellulosilytica]|uniref:Uncharacterized protein n=1 Tax=Acidisoma cellulosilyticum TaxID=2802395 RepID=A0A963Z579_9PROT|nr:hypothetical protein [Acidisoma cellulosilyticum]MCB8882898.1 hypothetical protein [Acidisoma cellulosilyticum]